MSVAQEKRDFIRYHRHETMIYFIHRFHKSSSKVCSKENQQFEDLCITLRIFCRHYMLNCEIRRAWPLAEAVLHWYPDNSSSSPSFTPLLSPLTAQFHYVLCPRRINIKSLNVNSVKNCHRCPLLLYLFLLPVRSQISAWNSFWIKLRIKVTFFFVQRMRPEKKQQQHFKPCFRPQQKCYGIFLLDLLIPFER